MRLRFSLFLQTLAMLFLYLATLLIVVSLLFNAQFGLGWEAAIQSPLGERFATIAGAINSQLRAATPAEYNEILRSFGNIYHADFYVFDVRREQIAGDKVTLPPSLLTKFGPPMPFHHIGLPPPEAFFGGHFDGTPPEFRDGFGPGPHENSNEKAREKPNKNPQEKSQDRPSVGPFAGQPAGPFAGHFAGHDHPPGPPEFGGDGPPTGVFHPASRFVVKTTNPDRFWVCARVFVYSPSIKRPIPGFLIAACDSLLQSSLILDFQFVAILLAGLLLFSVLFWWPFIYRITSALSRLTQATESIAQGKFDTRVSARGDDEIGRLAGAVDAMAEKLDGYVKNQKRLLADISHELFSPLARLQLALEILESYGYEDQTSQIDDIREEVQEMNNLVAELIAYSKAGMMEAGPELTALNINDMVTSLVAKLSNAEKVQIDVAADIFAAGDRLLIERAIANVVRNAIRYAGDKGPIVVTASKQGQSVIIEIADEGPGVSEEALKHLAEPFYRPEPSRNRSMGGYGLGLAIVKSCVEACQGSLSLSNKLPQGFEVKITLKSAREN